MRPAIAVGRRMRKLGDLYPTVILVPAGFPAKMAHYYSARFPRLDIGGGRSGSGELDISAAEGLFCTRNDALFALINAGALVV